MSAYFNETQNRGCPLFPFPAGGLKLLAGSGTVCPIHEVSNQRATPFSLAFFRHRPQGREAPEEASEVSCFRCYCLFAPNPPTIRPMELNSE